MASYIQLFLSTLAILSAVASLVIVGYLVRTESKAPKFIDSVRSMNGKPLQSSPIVSVIVAARNEEKMVESCILSFLEQSYQNLEVIVVDDSSTDGTLEIVKNLSKKDGRVRAMEAGMKPEGWVGKTWPCWRGFEGSSGELLVFADADSIYTPEIIEQCVKYVELKGIDLFSLGPRVRTKGIWAISVIPLVSGAINLLYPMQKVNDKKSKRAYVFGTFFLVRRNVYEKTGGHRQIRGEIVEDAAVANLVKTSGYNLRIERGTQFLSTVWEDDFRSIFSGLERVISSSVKGVGLISLLNAVFLFVVMIYPIAFLLGFGLYPHRDLTLILGAGASVLNVISFLALGGFELKTITGKIGLNPLLYPLGGLVFISAIVSTTIKITQQRDLKWKGQGYKLSDQKVTV
ncbi:MAG: glycosyltransferase [Thaumarchaeota archaeon]|nr:glycosyltransferase [Nitrososphaerota archaeon]